VLVLLVNGTPKAIHYVSQLDAIEDGRPERAARPVTIGTGDGVEHVE
jgi:hypothetical protein